MNFNFEKTGTLGLLTFDGELTEERSDRLKEALMVSLDNAEHVVVNFENVTKIDFICVQLFCQALKKAKRLKRHLTLTGMQEDAYKKIEEAGMTRMTAAAG
jgi:anti-anti-sigma factor